MNADKVVVRRHYEWHVPANGLWGATWVDLDKKMSMAARTYRELKELPEGEALPDDALRIRPGDEMVVIYFEVETE